MDDLNVVELNLYTSYYMSLRYLQECQAAIGRENAALEERVASLEDTSRKFLAFLNIAKAHTSNLVKPTGPQPFDNRRLSQLAVQIVHPSNDPAAGQLYTETVAQMMWADQQDRKVRAESESRISAAARDARLLIGDPLEFFYKALINYDSRFRHSGVNLYFPTSSLALGCWTKPFPHAGPELRSVVAPVFKEDTHFFPDQDTVLLPQEIQPHAGQLIVAEYTPATEAEVLGGIQRLLTNAAVYYGPSRTPLYRQVSVVDPIRLSAAGLGPVAALSGKDRFIDPVPNSVEAVRKKVGEIAAGLSRPGSAPKTGLYIFLGFPDAYDSLTASQIRQLAASAKSLGVTVLLACGKTRHPNDMVEELKPSALGLPAPGEAAPTGEQFLWYPGPANLDSDVP